MKGKLPFKMGEEDSVWIFSHRMDIQIFKRPFEKKKKKKETVLKGPGKETAM